MTAATLTVDGPAFTPLRKAWLAFWLRKELAHERDKAKAATARLSLALMQEPQNRLEALARVAELEKQLEALGVDATTDQGEPHGCR